MAAGKNLPAAIVIGVVGLALAGWGAWRWYRTSGSESWPTVEAKVTSSSVSSYSTGKRASSRNKPRYRVDFVFEYAVAGTPYTGKGDAPGFSSQEEAEQTRAQRYAPQTPVRLWYDPADPANHVLSVGVAADAYAFLVLGGILAAIAGIGFLRRR